MPAPKPKRISIRSYQVGFGDCFLLGFHYKTSDRYVLIDYGSTARPKNSTKDHMMKVAKSIQATCGDDLHAIVATHRHRDHISGFATKADGKGTGDVIGALKPDLVIQPWTEDPSAQRDANKPTKVSQSGRALIGMLDDMHGVAEVIYKEVEGWRPSALRSRLSFMGENNIKNLSAVENLMKMGKKRRYVHFGAKSGLILPGVKVHVLGPPTLEQTDTIRKQRSKDETEFWHLMALTGELSMSARELLFPQEVQGATAPPVESLAARADEGTATRASSRNRPNPRHSAQQHQRHSALPGRRSESAVPGGRPTRELEVRPEPAGDSAAPERRDGLQGRAPRQPQRHTQDPVEQLRQEVLCPGGRPTADPCLDDEGQARIRIEGD